MLTFVQAITRWSWPFLDLHLESIDFKFRSSFFVIFLQYFYKQYFIANLILIDLIRLTL